ncbi:MAG: tetratricopeptide repeat-containing sensor histidine kinase [Flavobacterium sp.]
MIIRIIKYCIFFCFFFFFFSCNEGLKKNNTKLEQVDYFLKSYNKFNVSERDKTSADSVGKVLLNLKNTQESRDVLRKYILLTESDRKYIDELFKRSRKQEDLGNEAQAYFLLGQYYEKKFQTDSTFYNYTKAEFLFKSINDSVNLQDVYAHKAILLLNHNIFTEGQTQILKAMSLNRSNKGAKAKYLESMIMARALNELEQYDEALKESDRALLLLEDPAIKNVFNEDAIRLNKVTINANIAEIYIKQKDYEKAQSLIHYTIDNLIINGSTYDSLMLAHLLYNLADVDSKSNNYIDVEKNLKNAISIQLKYNNLQDHNSYKIALAEFYYHTGNQQQVRQVLDEVMSYAKKHNNYILEKNVLSVLLRYEKEDYFTNFIRYEEINKLILDQNNMIKNTFARLSFEADNLQRVNEKLQNQKEIITKVGGGLFFIATVVFFILLFRQKSKEMSLVKLFQKDTEKYYNSIMNVQNELAEARHLERKDIARELHEGVLNRLFVTRFLLMQVNKDSVEDHKTSLINEVKEVEHYIRGVSHALANDDEFKINEFDQLLEDLVFIQNRSEITKFHLYLDTNISFSKLSNKYKVHIYRIVQECLQNVHKHSQATECNVSFLVISNTTFEVVIKDNGCGFNTDIVKKGIGFANIKGRIELMNSQLVIVSIKEKGTKISFVIESKYIQDS